MESIYDIRVTRSSDYDGVVHEEYYATTFYEGAEWCVNSEGEPEFPIGNVSADEDEVVAIGVLYEEMKSFLNGDDNKLKPTNMF